MSKNRVETKQEQPKTLQERILAFLKEAGIIFGAFLVLNSFVIASFVVPTGSMENEVMTGDFLFVNKFIYGGTSPRNIPLTNVRLPWFRLPALKQVERGDVIVFEFPGMRDELESPEFQFYLKRCMALPGDTLKVIDRVVYVNGTMAPIPRNIRFDSHYIQPAGIVNPQIFPPGAPWNEDNYGPLVIPYEGMQIPISRENFERWYTFIRREGNTIDLRGSNVYINNQPATSYTVKRDYLFGMGDHRDNSLDGRFWGFIPKENLVGTPLIVYWSWDTDLPLYNIFGKLGSVRLGRIGTVIR